MVGLDMAALVEGPRQIFMPAAYSTNGFDSIPVVE